MQKLVEKKSSRQFDAGDVSKPREAAAAASCARREGERRRNRLRAGKERAILAGIVGTAAKASVGLRFQYAVEKQTRSLLSAEMSAVMKREGTN